MSRKGISRATIKNWKRLGTDPSGRLMSRANKERSGKRIVPFEYLSDRANLPLIEVIVSATVSEEMPLIECIYTLCVSQLRAAGILDNENVRQVMSEYEGIPVRKELAYLELPDDEFDFIGTVYQSLLTEGSRNKGGIYYTPREVSAGMTAGLDFSAGQRFLDPCCGSGSFLLSVSCDHPEQLAGIDSDPVAVLITRTNLLCRYKDVSFIPHILCTDFLGDDDCLPGEEFDYICTNPPWGARTSANVETERHIRSGESFSEFFVKSFIRLRQGGMIHFLFPESVLNVRTHRDIRQFMLDECALKSVTFYQQSFSGVVTQYVGISAENSGRSESITINRDGETFTVTADSFRKTDCYVFNILNGMDISVIEKVRSISPCDLSQSIWVLGIVTGNNREKLSDTCEPGMEPVYTGKEIAPYVINPARKFVYYDRTQLQQCSRDEFYRTPEKLVYRFISDRLVFAYDDKQRLILNSANGLIPSVPGMSVKTVMAFLNSALYSFMYRKLFGEIKVLKANLLELRFPVITAETNARIESLADEMIRSGDAQTADELEAVISDLFGLTAEERDHIRRETGQSV